jgi:hypothetical protein
MRRAGGDSGQQSEHLNRISKDKPHKAVQAQLAPVKAHEVNVERSIKRSKAALCGVPIDALLAHEALASGTLTQFRRSCERQIEEGLIGRCGYSGTLASLRWNGVDMAAPNCVVQCSIIDAPHFAKAAELRLFHVIRTIIPILLELGNVDATYAASLRDCLQVTSLDSRQQFAAALAIACSLTTRASLIVATSNLLTLHSVVTALQNTSLQSWATFYANRHAVQIWGNQRVDGF